MFWFSEVGLSLVVFSGLNILGLVMTLASKSVFGAWCGLELSFFALVPLLVGKGARESESSFKYFLIQVVGSGFLLVGLTGVVINGFMCSTWFFLLVGFCLKMGMFPFHMWVPSVVGYSGWGVIFFLLVVQKIGPFWVISGLGLPICVFYVFLWTGILTSMVGAVGGLNQTSIRPLLAYSSLSHSGWMLFLSMVDWAGFMFYFVVYIMLLLGVVYLSSVRLISGVFPLSCYFLSLGGLPPFLGSFGKIIGMNFICGWSVGMLCLLILSSMVSLGYYTWIFISLNLNKGGLSGGKYFDSGYHFISNIALGIGLLVTAIGS